MLGALTLASLGLIVSGSALCPAPCQCLDNLTTISCIDRGLDRIPDLLQGTEELYASHNQIQELIGTGMERLQVLYIN